MEFNNTDLGRMRRILRHNLRNAASGIKAATSLLSSELDGRLQPREREYFPLIQRECERICDLTQRIEDYFFISVDEKCSFVGSIVKSTLASLHATHPVIEVHCAAEVLSSQKLVCESTFQTLLYELLVNAHEASFKPVTLCVEDQNEECCVRIIDQGEGLSEEHAPMAHEPFFTTRSRSMGLGLSIARRHLERYGKSVRFGREELGHFVEFSLPFAAATVEGA